MSNTPNTIASIEARRAELKAEIARSSERISRRWNALTTPPPENSEFQKWVNQGERIFAIYDGAMMGYKVYRRLGGLASLFKRKKKKNK